MAGGGGRRVTRVVLSGASGRTGREVGRAIVAAPDCALVGALGETSAGRDVGEVLGLAPLGFAVARDLDAAAGQAGCVLVDFSRADAARRLVPEALRRGMPAVVGTTGLGADDLAAFEAAAADSGTGACVIANFSVGAALTARLAALAMALFSDVEIIELHGSHKRDRPSGTAAALARDLTERGGGASVPVHSVRLPGLVAHQEVLMGRPGELLTIRHDVFGREAYTAGVLVAVRRAHALRGVVTRLEEVWEAF
jgi:4-hydroxy-tetrahydrodipicolinate reductase